MRFAPSALRLLLAVTAISLLAASTPQNAEAITIREGANTHAGVRSIACRSQVFYYHIWEAGVRSFIITFDIYVILNTFGKYDDKRPDPICL